MKLDIELDVNTFSIPNKVTIKSKPRPREEGIKQGISFTLGELDESVIDILCETFVTDVKAEWKLQRGEG